MLKSYWLTAIFLHLPVRAEALKAALGTAGHHSLMKGFALHPFCDGGDVGNAQINCNLKPQQNSIILPFVHTQIIISCYNNKLKSYFFPRIEASYA